MLLRAGEPEQAEAVAYICEALAGVGRLPGRATALRAAIDEALHSAPPAATATAAATTAATAAATVATSTATTAATGAAAAAPPPRDGPSARACLGLCSDGLSIYAFGGFDGKHGLS